MKEEIEGVKIISVPQSVPPKMAKLLCAASLAAGFLKGISTSESGKNVAQQLEDEVFRAIASLSGQDSEVKNG